MDKIKIFLLLIISISIVNCNEEMTIDEEKTEEDQEQLEYLVFGYSYAMCVDSETCVEIFKLTDTKLYEDRKDGYPDHQDFYIGDFEELPPSKFDIAKDLIDYFPNGLFNEENNVIGCPECLDQGGLYIEYNSNKTHRFWIIDQDKFNLPIYLHQFRDQVNEKIRLINE